jgi:hypothetical protein
MDVAVLWPHLFDVRQLGALHRLRHGDAAFLPRFFAFLEGGVIAVTAAAQDKRHRPSLFRRGVEFVFVRLAHRLLDHLRLALPLDVLANRFLAHIASSGEEKTPGPQRRQFPQVRKLLSQMMRTAPLETPRNLRRERVRVCADELVDMIGLNRQFNHPPVTLGRYLLNDLLQAVANWANKRLAPPLGTPDDVIDDEVAVVSFMRVFPVDSMLLINTAR